MFAFDLKSAYHQIEMFKEHWKFLGLALKIDGVKKFFVFTCLPFGLNDAARALTKKWPKSPYSAAMDAGEGGLLPYPYGVPKFDLDLE